MSRTPAVARAGLLVTAWFLLAACAPSSVQEQASYAGPRLPKPARVVVQDFTFAADVVALDAGVGPRLARATSSGTDADDRRQIGLEAADAAARALVEALVAKGLPAVRATAASSAGGQPELVIQGVFQKLDQGNRTRRQLVGLGAGRSHVVAAVDAVYEAPGTRPITVLTMQADAESGRKPGAAETLGVGAVTGRIATSAALTAGTGVLSEALSAGVDADAKRLAGAIAERIAAFATGEGWIAP